MAGRFEMPGELPGRTGNWCCLDGAGPVCVCTPTEKALRIWCDGVVIPPPMTAEQRAWCADQIGEVEGHARPDLATVSDDDLADGVLDAWQDYCRDKGLR